MKRFFVVLSVAAVGVTILALAGSAQAHSLPTAVENPAGHYQGFYASSVTGQIAPFTMDIAPSRTSIFSGLLLVPAVREPFHVAIARNGAFAAVGTGPSGFVAVGRSTLLAGGASSLSTAGYLMRTPSGLDRGSLRFVKSFTGGDASQIAPAVTGSCTAPDGSAVSIDFRMIGTSGGDFSASVAFGGSTFPLVGSVGSPDLRTGSAPLVATGVATGGSIDFDGSWVSGGQPHMQGTATVSLADGSVSVDDCALVPAVRTTAGQ